MTDQPDLQAIAEATDSIESRWPEAISRAKSLPEGGLPSVWTIPLEALVQEREHVIRQLGDDPEAMKVPKSMRADAQEKTLPEHVRAAYRRGVYLHGRLKTAHQRAVAKAQKR